MKIALFLLPTLMLTHGLVTAAEIASPPGEIQPEPSTLHCLAVRWPVLGDENGNCVDKGTALPNFSDALRGRAPDLGALESGDTLPPYGPRGGK